MDLLPSRGHRGRDLILLQRPCLWAAWPFLPMVRPTLGGTLELRVVYDARGASGTYGYACTVFLANLFLLPRSEAEILALPRCAYDSFEELLDAGWGVN